MRSSIWLWLASFILTASPVWAASADLVGERGDPDRIKFVGNETFDAKVLRSALRYDVDLLLAGHPKADAKAFRQLLERRIAEGYLNSGFPYPQVTVRFDEQRTEVVATIIEGSRYKSGEVEVVGAKSIPVARFVELLLNPTIDPRPPHTTSKRLWKRGKPTSFSANHWQSKHDDFQKIFHSLGYYDVSFIVRARPLENQTASLLIEITDEGPRAVLGDIEVVGTSKNTPEDVIRFLDLAPGTLLDADTKARITNKLASAARFLKHDVEVISPPFGNAPSLLKIALLEFAEAPPLNESFSVEEETMIQLAKWLNQFRESADDFEATVIRHGAVKDDAPAFTITPAEIRVAISPRTQGILAFVRLVTKNDQDVFQSWIHLTPSMITLDAPQRALRFQARGINQTVIGNLNWSATPPDAEGRMSRFLFSMGVKGNSEVPLSPFLLNTSVDPVVVVREAHKQKDSLKLTDDLLLIDKPEFQMAIERATGRLLKWESSDGDGGSLRVTFAPGRYEKLLAEYQQLTADSRVIVPGDYPISNLLTFLANCVPDWQVDPESATQVRFALAQSVLKRGAFHSFDTLLLDFLHQPEDSFSLPASTPQSQKTAPLGWTAFLWPAARLIAPPSSWPVTLSREYMFARSKYSHFAGEAIQGMLNDQEAGPVLNLAAAYLFGMLNPRLRLEFAHRGLSRLQRERFFADFQPLLDPNAPVGKMLLATTKTIQELDDHEIESIVNQFPLPERDREALAHSLRLIPAHRDDDSLDAIRIALDDAWQPLIEPYLRNLLRMLAN